MENFQDIRDGVSALCSDFPGEYWRGCDRERAYPADFVNALTEAGYLGALIPEEYGGSGLPISAAAAILEEPEVLEVVEAALLRLSRSPGQEHRAERRGQRRSPRGTRTGRA